MTDIILLQTRFGYWEIIGARTPTALLSIAATPCKRGYKVVLIDQRINPNWKSKVRKHISAGAKIVCLTAIIGEQIKHMMEASKFVKSLNQDVLIFLGGSWAQTDPETCLQDSNVDVVCYGEGDYLLPELMAYCEGKKKIEDILGIVYRTKNGVIKRNPPKPLIKNLDDLPKLPYHLADLKAYSTIGFRPNKPSMALTVSRGCGHRCTFCSIPCLYGKSWRSHSVGRVMDDLFELETTYGIKDFLFQDDNIGGSYKWFSEFVGALAKSKKDYYWSAVGIRAPTVLRLTDKDMDNLLNSGCKTLDIGVESGNERVLKLIKKDITLEMVRNANKKMNKYPIIVKYTFMGGFPTESEKEYLDTLNFRRLLLKENKYAVAPIYTYTPFPKTPMFDLAISKGLKPPTTLLGWADFNYDTWYKKHPSWLTKRMIRLIENSVFLSYFADKNMSYKYPNSLMNTLFKLYQPIAKFRYDHNFYNFMVEKLMADALMSLNNRMDLFNKAQKEQTKKLKDEQYS